MLCKCCKKSERGVMPIPGCDYNTYCDTCCDSALIKEIANGTINPDIAFISLQALRDKLDIAVKALEYYAKDPLGSYAKEVLDIISERSE